MDPNLSTMSKDSVSFVLAVLPEGLSWSEIHRLLLMIGADCLGQRTSYSIPKLPVPSLFELGKVDCDHDSQ
jgi:hypothetical protein